MTDTLHGAFASAVTRLFDEGHAKAVVSLGVPKSAICGRPPLVGVAAVEVDSGGWFQFIEDGELALIVADGLPGAMGWKTVDEVVSIRTKAPGKWWRATGAVPVFGRSRNFDILDYQATLGEPIRLYETPWSWLRGGGDGLVVLDWSFDPLGHFKGLRIQCETAALAERLRARTCAAALSTFDIDERRHAA